jgi:uncharacterized membrane-anchored protein YhcB (DUF1043 family)
MENRSRAWAAALLAGTFVAGIAVGAGGRAAWTRHAAAARPRGLDRMMAELDEELRLAPAQHDTVRAILERHFAALAAAWDSVRPHFDSIRARMDSDVVRHLSADQAARYRDHVTRFRRQREGEPGGRNR